MTVVADNGGMADELSRDRKPKARDLNELVRYTMWSVFRVTDRGALEAGGAGEAAGSLSWRVMSARPVRSRPNRFCPTAIPILNPSNLNSLDV